MEHIYSITVINDEDETLNARNVGFYFRERDASRALQFNTGAMDEDGYYSLAVIEKVPEGILWCSEQISWFKWDKNKWVVCEKPEKFIGLSNFGIG